MHRGTAKTLRRTRVERDGRITMTRNVGRWLMLALVGGGTALLLAPMHARGYALLGGALRLSQRDVRVFNNFTNPEANENTTHDPSFPGATGATLAIWKACVEWGSELHGDGNGDPTQPGGLGSGGAIFDPSWQGLATNPGRTNDNIISAIEGTDFGVLAFTEKPIGDGWRIRFYQGAAVWRDDPGNYFGDCDIQGVATHEYGHALGLDHTGVDGATMTPFHPDNWVPARSIELDDIQGLQAIYGVKLATKPHIETYSIASHVLTITGANFAPAENEVWFTHAAPGNDGTPLKIPHVVARAGGTVIELALPIQAAPGDVLVKNAGDDYASLSNAFPFDPTMNPCPGLEVYGTAKLTSIGTSPNLVTTGSPHLVTNDLTIATDGGVPDAPCVLFFGPNQASIPWLGGTLYVGGPYARARVTQLDSFGSVFVPIPIDATMIGTTRYYQLWFADAGDPFGAGISNAVKVSFCP
jgi:hypothetical protein